MLGHAEGIVLSGALDWLSEKAIMRRRTNSVLQISLNSGHGMISRFDNRNGENLPTWISARWLF